MQNSLVWRYLNTQNKILGIYYFVPDIQILQNKQEHVAFFSLQSIASMTFVSVLYLPIGEFQRCIYKRKSIYVGQADSKHKDTNRISVRFSITFLLVVNEIASSFKV